MLFKVLLSQPLSSKIFSVIENRQKKLCNKRIGLTFEIVNCSDVFVDFPFSETEFVFY